MNTLAVQVREKLKVAMKEKDQVGLDTLRAVISACTNELVANGKTPQDEIDDATVVNVVGRLIKQRKDSIEQFTKGGREDLATKEKAELVILESFLPSMMSKEEIKIVASQRIEALKSSGAFDPKAGGKITGMIMKELAGKADGSDVKVVVDELMKA